MPCLTSYAREEGFIQKHKYSIVWAVLNHCHLHEYLSPITAVNLQEKIDTKGLYHYVI